MPYNLTNVSGYKGVWLTNELQTVKGWYGNYKQIFTNQTNITISSFIRKCCTTLVFRKEQKLKQYIALEDVANPQAEPVTDTLICMRFIKRAMEKFKEYDEKHGYPCVEDCHEILMETITEMEKEI